MNGILIGLFIGTFITLFVLIYLAGKNNGYIIFLSEKDLYEILIGSFFGGLLLGLMRSNMLGYENGTNNFYIIYFGILSFLFFSKFLMNGMNKDRTLYGGEFYLT